MREVENTQREIFKLLATRLRRNPAIGVIGAFIVLFVVFSSLNSLFLSLGNITSMFTLISELGIVTVGVAFLMITGEFDLSVSSVYALSGFLFVVLANNMSSILALIITLGVACVIGFANGIVTVRVGVSSFITTLGTQMFLRGILLAVTGGSSVSYHGDKIVPALLTNPLGWGVRPSHLWFIGVTILFSLILTRTRYGNWVFATGGDREVARAMGVHIDRVKIQNFVISALLAALSGCIVLTRFKIANASFGVGLELEAIAAAVIGGTFLTGGYGTIVGAFFGALIMGMMRTGLIMAGAPAYWYEAFVGAILIVAAAVNLKLHRFEI